MDVRSTTCERAAQFVSLDLDGELSRFEQAVLKRHLRRCARCAADARDIVAVTECLRATPLEQMCAPIVVSRPSRRIAHLVQSVAAGVAVASVGVWLGLSSFDPGRAPGRVATFSPKAGAVANERYDWPAGLPRTPQIIRFAPGGLYTAATEW